MAEIKSTLDLVMERTRHLTLSEEEKREQALSEFKRNLNGLLQRFHDGGLTLDRFTRELHALQEDSGIADSRIPTDEVLKRLDLGGSNEAMLTLLSEVFHAETNGLRHILRDYDDGVRSAAERRIAMIKEHLFSVFGISGTGVEPNLDASEEWADELRTLAERFENALARETAAVKGSI